MKKRTVKLFLEDINEFISLIEKYIEGLDYKKFCENQMVIDAVLRNLELIGEASKNIPEEVKSRFSDLPWPEMIGLRNIAAHGYFKIDLEIIWDIITKDIPESKKQLKKILIELFQDKKINL